MGVDLAYLDYNATTPIRPEAAAAVADALAQGGNPSSVHGAGRRARGLVEGVREDLARLIGAKHETLVFTSGGTEANSLALTGTVRGGLADDLIVGATEHDSVRVSAQDLGVPLHILPVKDNGLPDLDWLGETLDRLSAEGRRPLVSLMHANNETGTIAPIAEIVTLVRARSDGLVHTDAVQTVGRLSPDVRDLGVDLLSLSGHKLGGPPGIGALMIREGLALAPLIQGGGQELGRRSGTENVAAIAGLGAAVRALKDDDTAQLARWRDAFEAELRTMVPEVVIFGADAPRLPNTSCFGVSGLTGETQVMALDLAGVAVSSGAACSSGKVARSHVLDAMGADPVLASSAIRVSIGWASREEDLARCVAAWADHVQRWRRRQENGSAPQTGAYAVAS